MCRAGAGEAAMAKTSGCPSTAVYWPVAGSRYTSAWMLTLGGPLGGLSTMVMLTLVGAPSA